MNLKLPSAAIRLVTASLAVLAVVTFGAVTVRAALDTAKIETITGLKGTWTEAEGVFKVTQPRNDLPIAVDGWAMPPFMGLTSWAAFSAGGTAEVMVAGDLVLFEDEVNPVMSAALDAGLSVTALHNHFFFDQPRVYFMHIGGEGKLDAMSAGVKAALAKQKAIRTAQPQPGKMFGSGFAPAKNAITGGAMDQILGTKGQANNGMFKVVIGREVKMPCGCFVTKEMGVNTWAAFAGTDDNAVVDGDFAVLEDELQPVLKSLRGSGINIVAIHSHMTHEQPRMLFLHYWGRGAVEALTRNLKSALDVQAAVPPPMHEHAVKA
jgi:hypothetical protein